MPATGPYLSRDKAVAYRFSTQHGLITRQQAVKLGMSTSGIERRLAGGRWVRVCEGVYKLAGSVESLLHTLLATVLWAGEGSALSHGSALMLWGAPGEHNLLEVTTTRRRDARLGFRVHPCRALSAEHVVTHHGVPVTTPERTVLDVAARLSPEALNEVLEFFLNKEHFTLTSLDAFVRGESSRGLRGRRILLKWLNARLRRLPRPGAEMEEATRACLARRGDVAPPVRGHLEHNGPKLRIPLAYPKYRLALFPFDPLGRGPQPHHENRHVMDELRERGWTCLLVNCRILPRRRDAISANVRHALYESARKLGLEEENPPWRETRAWMMKAPVVRA